MVVLSHAQGFVVSVLEKNRVLKARWQFVRGVPNRVVCPKLPLWCGNGVASGGEYGGVMVLQAVLFVILDTGSCFGR